MRSHSKQKFAFSACLLLAVCLGRAAAADVVVIAHEGLAVSAADIKDVFTGDKQLAGGTKLVPIDNKALSADFLTKFLQMDATKYEQTWRKKSFRDGMKAPEMKNSDAEVIEAVKSSPGGVGYVATAPAGVAVIKK
jgi:hypothetical protein